MKDKNLKEVLKKKKRNYNFKINLTTKKLFIIIISIQLALIGSIFLDRLGFNIPILREVIGFVYLTFIPGFLILKILKITNIEILDTLLYSAGLSLSFLMFVGVLVNYLYPTIGISSKPLAEDQLTITLNILILFLYILFYIRNKEFSEQFTINTNQIFLPITLLLGLLPLLAVFGAYLLDFYNNNTLILILLIFLSIFPILVAYNKISEKIYPLIILTTSFVLLSYNNLLGNYIRPTDAVFEFYFANLVIENGFWDKMITGPLNSMLSVVIIPPIFSEILGISLTWVYKIVAPMLSLLIPLGLYKTYQIKWNKKLSFFASFLFLSMFTYYTWCAVTMKMLFAGIFLTLLIFTMINEKIDHIKKKIMFTIFCLSLITSHYGTSYIFMISLFISIIIFYLFNKTLRSSFITPMIVVFYSGSTFLWYIHTSAVSTINAAIDYLSYAAKSILMFYLPPSTETLLFGEWSATVEILKLLYLAMALFMLIGLVSELYKTKRVDEYFSLSIPFFSSLLLIYLCKNLYVGRIWFIVSILLTPYCIKGIQDLFLYLNNILIIIKGNLKIKKYYFKYVKFKFIDVISSNVGRNREVGFILVSIYLMIFLLFNSGFSSEVIFKDYGPSIYLSKCRILDQGNIIEKERFFRKYMTDYDVLSAKWLSKNKETKIKKIYCDKRGLDPLHSYGNISSSILFLTNRTTDILGPSYIYLKYVNVQVGIMGMHASLDYPLFKFKNSPVYLILLKNGNKIYSNEGSEIYYFK